MFIAALALSLVMFQDPATASQPQPGAAAGSERANDQAQSPDEEVVCRRERVTGTNRPQRICMTRLQWRQLRERSLDRQRDIDALGTQNSVQQDGIG